MASFGPSIRYNSTTLRNLNLDYMLRRSTRRRLFTFNILCKPQRFAIGVRQTIDRPTSRIDTNNVSFDCPRLRSSLLKVRIDRHATPPSAALACGCFNVRSLNNKVDDLLDVRREQLIDVLFLVETWHDSDSVCISRLRANGFQVIDRRRHLRSASSAALIIPPSTHVTIGDRAFPVAAAKTWNSLSSFVTSSPSLTIFRRRLKTELFSFSYS